MADRLDALLAALRSRQEAQVEAVRVLTALLAQAEADAKRDPGPLNVARVIAIKREMDEVRGAMVVRVGLGVASQSPRLVRSRVVRNGVRSDDWRVDRY